MVAAQYELKIDTKRDGTYGASIDDLSSRLIQQMSWNGGMGDSYQDFAPPSMLTVQLENADGAFNPDTLGSELVVNGDFASWAAGNPSSWTVTGKVGSNPTVTQVGQDALFSGSGTGACNFFSTSASVSISQTILTAGTTYKVTLNVTAASPTATGYIGVYDNATLISPRYHFSGMYTFYFNAASTTFKILSTGAANITIDDVSVKATSIYGNLLTEGTLCRLRSTFNASTRFQFVGRISKFNITPGSISRRVATVQVSDCTLDLLDTEYIPPLSTNVTADRAIEDILIKPIVPFPYSSSYWMLGIQGASELDLTTYLYVAPDYDLASGDTTFTWIGDNAIGAEGNGISAQQFIRDTVAGEAGGRFFWNHTIPGYTFQNRHFDALSTASTFTITDSDYELEMSVYERETILNKTSVTFEPRKTGTPGAQIWASDTTYAIGPNASVKVTARYRDPTNPSARVGATNVLPLLPGTDIIAASVDGVSGSLKMSVDMVAGANSAELTITNGNTFFVRVSFLQIRGTTLTTFDQQTVTSVNGDSENKYKRATEQISYKYIDDVNFAQSIADYRVYRFGDANTRFSVIGWIANNSTSRMTNALSLSVGDRVTVSDTWLNHNADYVIVGYRHVVTFGGDHHHEATAILKPLAHDRWWLLGTSTLGISTRLGL